MEYLSFLEYRQMGGDTLGADTFSAAEQKARYVLNAQAAGQTGRRIAALPQVPQPVKDCIFSLLEWQEQHKGGQISSESQSQGGESESYSYVTKTENELQTELESLIADVLIGGGAGWLLYRGLCL